LSFGNIRRKDPGTVFVAGATGQAGIRIAQTLLREGFSVRAGAIEGKREVPERCLPPSSLCCSDVFCASHYIHQGLTACVLWPS
jgi:nucleoside-diphosphate-sugar epimerase